MSLKTDYKDDLFIGNRKYNLTNNDDGTVSLIDVTDYVQEGNVFSATDINLITTEINSMKCITKELSITSGMWKLDSTTNLYKATISWSGITSNHRIDVIFDLPSIELASDVINYTDSSTDYFYLYSDKVVENTLTGKAYAKIV